MEAGVFAPRLFLLCRSRYTDAMSKALCLSLVLVVAASANSSLALRVVDAPMVRVDELTINDAPPPSIYASYLRTAIDSQIPAIRECYRARLAERPALQGSLRLRLWVSARQVIRTTPETSLGDAPLEECTRAQIRRFTLPSQVPEGGVSVKFLITFTPPATGEPARVDAADDSLAPAPNAPIPPRVMISVGLARPSATLSTRLPSTTFQSCANIEGSVGTVLINVSTDRRGRLRATRMRASISSRAVQNCVVSAAQATAGTGAAERNVVTVLFASR